MTTGRQEQEQRPLTVRSLTRKERRILAANTRKWDRKLQPHRDAIDASERITGEDLRLIVRGAS